MLSLDSQNTHVHSTNIISKKKKLVHGIDSTETAAKFCTNWKRDPILLRTTKLRTTQTVPSDAHPSSCNVYDIILLIVDFRWYPTTRAATIVTVELAVLKKKFRHFHAPILPLSRFLMAILLILIVSLVQNSALNYLFLAKLILLKLCFTNYLGLFVLYLCQYIVFTIFTIQTAKCKK